MQQEKDYLQREIQKLTILLTRLISKISGSDSENIETTYNKRITNFAPILAFRHTN